MTTTTAAGLSTYCAFASRIPPDDTPKKAEARTAAHRRCANSTFARQSCTCTCHTPPSKHDQGEPAMATLSDLNRTDRSPSDNGAAPKKRRTDDEKRAIVARYDKAETKAEREQVLNDHGGIAAQNLSMWRKALGLPPAPRRQRGEAPPERKPRKAHKKREKKADVQPEPAPEPEPTTETWLGDYVSVMVDERDRNVLDALAFLQGTVPDQLVSDLISALVDEYENDREVKQLIELRQKRAG